MDSIISLRGGTHDSWLYMSSLIIIFNYYSVIVIKTIKIMKIPYAQNMILCGVMYPKIPKMLEASHFQVMQWRN